MKTFFKILAAIIAVLVLVMLLVGKEYHFVTSTVINAPAEKVWQNMHSMKAFNQWNPFMELDPNIKVNYSGTSGNVGEQYCWEGNSEAGKGCHVITGMISNRKLSTKMLFKEPFESNATSDLILKPEGNTTKVTWTMDTELSYPMNLMSLFMDGEMEKSFGSGLQKLKILSEK